MPGILTHNLMPEDRADEPVRVTATRPAAVVVGATAVACSEHHWERRPDGGLRCTRCFAQTYPQRVLFR